VLAARTAVALEASLNRFQAAGTQNLGHLETQVAHDVQELLRVAQAKADATPPRSPVCGQAITSSSAGHARTFQTPFSYITIRLTSGYCKRCQKWCSLAATALGLGDTVGYSSAVQVLAALGDGVARIWPGRKSER
jgi:hypothetical protein